MSSSNQPTSPPANRFKDLGGREWILELNYRKLGQIRKQHQVDLGDLVNFAQTWGGLLIDDDKLIAVVWATIGDDAGDVTLDDFLGVMDGESVEAAKDALLEAVFFFTRPEKRELIRKATSALMAGYRHMIAKAETDLETVMLEVTQNGFDRLGMNGSKLPELLATSTTTGRSAKHMSPSKRTAKRPGRKSPGRSAG